MSNFKFGIVGIIGRANVGKSTFLNAVMEEKIAITSPIPQTTRTQILGIRNKEDSQIVFVDTPGIHKAKHRLGDILDEQAISAISSVDLILYFVDKKYSYAQDYVIRHFKQTNTPVMLVINKIDLLKSKMAIDDVILSYVDVFPFVGVYPISAKTNKHIDKLVEDIMPYLEDSFPYYSTKDTTTQTDFMRMGELIREKVLHHTKEEIPHSVAVIIDHTEDIDGIYSVYASIIVERPSQKAILIGKGGQMLKQIGTEARKDINKTLNTKIHLNLWIKVIKDWRNKPNELKGLGYDY